MRYRRAERCVQHAEAALEAGLEEDARAALDEARVLDSGAPAFETLRDAVRTRQAAVAAARQRIRHRRLAMAAALVVAVGAGAFWLRDSARQPATAADVFTAAPAAPPPAVAPAVRLQESPVDTEPPAPAPRKPVPTERAADAKVEPRTTAGRGSPAVGTGGVEAPAARTRPTAPPAPPVAQPLPGVRDAERADQRPSPAVMELPELQASTPRVPIDHVVTGLPSAALPSTAAPAPAPARPAAAAPSRPAEPDKGLEEAKVRAVLARFETAYSTLDAAAAQQVWLEVDEPSLSRAFESLQSQRVSLGRCAISVAGTTARAECSGSTTWTPRVGGGARTAPRQWTFDMAVAHGRWLIVRARAR